jgi:hypothetical protein
MSATPLPEHSLLRARGALLGSTPTRDDAREVSDEVRVEDAIIDVPEDLGDPERSAVVHDETESVSENLDSASEFDLREQQIVVAEDEDERTSA